MKNIFQYCRKTIGCLGDDEGDFIVRGRKTVALMPFEHSGEFKAYIVDEFCEIPDNFKLIIECERFIMIYNSEGPTFGLRGFADVYRVYRSDDCGCIIQLIKRGKENGLH